MLSSLIISASVLLVWSSASGQQCDHLGIAFYEDLACEPVYAKPDSCPVRYKCGDLKGEGGKQCIVRGKSYEVGDPIDNNKKSFSCEFGCFCSGFNETNTNPSCVQFTCAEYSGIEPPEGCYRKYNLEACCSTGLKCPTPGKEVFKCVVDGKEYREGERFAPKDSCHTCLCQKGFDGKYEAPFCKRQGCDAQVRSQPQIQNSCAPVFLKRSSDSGNKKCCPNAWACPDGTEEIERSDSNSDLTCKYGDQTLKLGDSFTKQINKSTKVKCECKIPPLVSCSV